MSIKNIFKLILSHANKNRLLLWLKFISLISGMSCFLFVVTWYYTNFNQEIMMENSIYHYRAVEYKPIDINNDRFDISSQTELQAKDIIKNIDGIVNSFRFCTPNSFDFKKQIEHDIKDMLWYADTEIFDVIEFQFLSGDANTFNKNDNSIVITDEYALLMNKSLNCIGEDIVIEGKSFIIAGVIKKMPTYYHIKFKCLGNIKSLISVNENTKELHCFTYFTSRKISNFITINNQFQSAVDNYDRLHNTNTNKIYAAPIWQNHTYNATKGFDNKEMEIYKLILLCGELILFLSLFSFFIISQSEFSSRNKEISIIKLYSNRYSDILKPIFIENIIFYIIALFVSLIILSLIINFSNYNLHFASTLIGLEQIAVYLVISLILSSMYIAYKIKNKNIAVSLKERRVGGISNSMYRNTIFSIQIILCLSISIYTYSIVNQYDYIRSLKKSYAETNYIYYKLNDDLAKKLNNYQNKNSHIKDIKILTSGELAELINREINNKLIIENDKKYAVFSFGFQNIPNAIGEIKSKFGNDFHYLDKSLEKSINREEETNIVLLIIISLLMINALINVAATLKQIIEKRKREFIIRKIYGASRFSLIKLLIYDSNLSIAIAIIISWVTSYLAYSAFKGRYIHEISLEFSQYILPSLIIFFFANLVQTTIAYLEVSKIPVKLLK